MKPWTAWGVVCSDRGPFAVAQDPPNPERNTPTTRTAEGRRRWWSRREKRESGADVPITRRAPSEQQLRDVGRRRSKTFREVAASRAELGPAEPMRGAAYPRDRRPRQPGCQGEVGSTSTSW